MKHDSAQAAGLEALETLRLIMSDDEATAAARVTAAKTLLDRCAPQEDAEAARREADEREAALAEARSILAALAELAATAFAGSDAAPALAQHGPPATDHAAD